MSNQRPEGGEREEGGWGQRGSQSAIMVSQRPKASVYSWHCAKESTTRSVSEPPKAVRLPGTSGVGASLTNLSIKLRDAYNNIQLQDQYKG